MDKVDFSDLADENEVGELGGTLRNGKRQINLWMSDEEVNNFQELFGVKSKGLSVLSAARYGALVYKTFKAALDAAADRIAEDILKRELGRAG